MESTPERLLERFVQRLSIIKLRKGIPSTAAPNELLNISEYLPLYPERFSVILPKLASSVDELLASGNDFAACQEFSSDLPYSIEETEKIKKEASAAIIAELNRYEQILRENLEVLRELNVPVVNVARISLPDNFQLIDLTQHFDPKLSVQETALFLSLLRDLGIIPHYSDKSLALLGSYLFGRSSQTVRSELGRVHNRNKVIPATLENIRALLEEMMGAINLKA